jgi:hypothetical protein
VNDNSGPTLDQAIFVGGLGTIRVSSLGEIWSGEQRIWTDDKVTGYRGDSVYSCEAHFIDCLKIGRPFESEGREYLEKTFAVVEGAYASLLSGCRVEIADIVRRMGR